MEARHEIMEKNLDLKFAVQNLRNVADPGRGGEYSGVHVVAWVHLSMTCEQCWNKHEPRVVADSRVTIQAHDFLPP